MTHDVTIDSVALPQPIRGFAYWRLAAPILSVLLLIAVVWQLRAIDLDRLRQLIPTSPAFWAVFAVSYLAPVVIEFVIFRRLWHVGADGFIALLRKVILNELLLDYVGEAYFYSWARTRITAVMSPFGAVKDVAILSALTANGITLGMLVLAYPFIPLLNFDNIMKAAVASIGLMVVISIAILIFGKRIFSLSKGELWVIVALLALRIVLSMGLSAVLWSLVLPGAPFGWWILLATARMLLSRLPLLTNKDVLFAGLAVVLFGRDTDVAALLALMASIGLVAHLVLGGILAFGGLLTLFAKPEPERAPLDV